MSGEEGFLKRWSRLKTKERKEVRHPSSPPTFKSQEAALTINNKREIDEALVSELPPVETLTKDSDFTAFLRKGVPEALRQQALRKLWASEPTIAAPDPLDFQNVDFAKLVSGDAVATSYEVGKEFADRIDAAAERIEEGSSPSPGDEQPRPAAGAAADERARRPDERQGQAGEPAVDRALPPRRG